MIRQVVFVLGVVAVAGCQPMYGTKPDRLRNPEVVKVKPKPEVKPEPPPAPVYLDKCKLPTPAQLAQRDRTGAQGPFTEGSNRFAEAEALPTESPEQAATAKQSLEKFRDALSRDHFHADATLGLARTYDTFHRKGCALALLKRIGQMRLNKAFQKEADRVANSVNQHADQWFAAYESEARDAVNP
jgi:hypothetical protein